MCFCSADQRFLAKKLVVRRASGSVVVPWEAEMFHKTIRLFFSFYILVLTGIMVSVASTAAPPIEISIAEECGYGGLPGHFYDLYAQNNTSVDIVLNTGDAVFGDGVVFGSISLPVTIPAGMNVRISQFTGVPPGEYYFEVLDQRIDFTVEAQCVDRFHRVPVYVLPPNLIGVDNTFKGCRVGIGDNEFFAGNKVNLYEIRADGSFHFVHTDEVKFEPGMAATPLFVGLPYGWMKAKSFAFFIEGGPSGIIVDCTLKFD